MTIRIPKWLLFVLAGALVIGGLAAAFFIGRSSGGEESSTPVASHSTTTSSTTSAEATQSVPACNEAQAKKAIAGSSFEAEVRQLHVVPASQPLISPHTAPPGYDIGKLDCHDFTGDGQEEMVVQLVCCTTGARFPWAIFQAEDGEWRLAFDRVELPSTISVQGDAVVEKTPAYTQGEALCCPSTYRFGRITWNGHAFVYRSNEGDPSRTIKATTQGVSALGAFNPQSGTPSDAANAFGVPSGVARKKDLCREDWVDLGLTIDFANLGGQDPCSDQGRVASIELVGNLAEQAGWKTSEGVTVGMSLQKLRSIYPDAKFQSFAGLRNVYVLIEGPSAVGTSGTYPVLAARVVNGKVSELRMYVGAAGE